MAGFQGLPDISSKSADISSSFPIGLCEFGREKRYVQMCFHIHLTVILPNVPPDISITIYHKNPHI